MSEQLLYTPSELLERAPDHIACYVGGGILPKNALVGIVAQSGAGKSFVVLDMLAHVALGWEWRGYSVERAEVLYVAGEGASGLPSRLSTWCEANEVHPNDLRDLLVMPRPLDLSEYALVAHVERELEARGARPGIVAIDTLSANAPVGFAENDSQQMKAYLDLARRLRDRWQCTVLFVHHAGHNSERERGSSDFRGSLDTMLFVRNDEGRRTMTMAKSRDFTPIPPVHFRLRSVGESAVIEFEQGGSTIPPLLASARQALAVVAEHSGSEPLKVTQWQKRCEGQLRSSQFYQVRKNLEGWGYVLVDPKRGVVLTNRGSEVLGLNSADPFNNSDRSPTGVRPERAHYSTPVPPIRGGTEWSVAGVPPESDRSNRSAVNTGPRPDQSRTSRANGPGLEPYPWDDFQCSSGTPT